MANEAERKRLERDWLLDSLKDSEDLEAFRALRHTHRHLVNRGGVNVVWELKDNKPNVLAVIRMVGIEASWGGGLTLETDVFLQPQGDFTQLAPIGSKDKPNEEIFYISSRPQRIPGTQVFVWVPFFNRANYAPFTWQDNTPHELRIDIAFRTTADQEMVEEGDQVVQPLFVFRKHYPYLG